MIPAAALIVTVAAAALSYRFVETPIRRKGFRGAVTALGTRRPVIRIAAGAAALALLGTVGLTGLAVVNAPGQGVAEQAVEQGEELLARPGYAVAPRRPQPLPTGDQILAIGDSVMLAAAPELQQAFPGIAIDASVSRQMFESEDIVGAIIAAGGMRPILVIGLGTNGWIKEQTLEDLRAMIGPKTMMILVNVQAPREWVPDVNATLADFAQRNRDVELANWHDAIQPQIDVLADDQVHPGPTGARIYAAALADALQRLSEIPPLLRNNEYGLASRPV